MNHIAKANSLIGDARRLARQIECPGFELAVHHEESEPVDPLQLSEDEVEGRIRGYVYEGFDVSLILDESKVKIVVREPTEHNEITVTSSLPRDEIEEIIEAVRSETEEVIVSLEDLENGVLLKTGVLHGHYWRLRKGSAEWKIIQQTQWCT